VGGFQGIRDDKKKLGLWRTGIEKAAKLSNVVCKVSGLLGGWDGGMDEWKFESQAELVDHVLKNFNENKVVFGGDWPVCLGTASYKNFLLSLQDHVMKHYGEKLMSKLFHDNAVKWYGTDMKFNL